MIRLRDLDESSLLDLLSEQTSLFTRMLHENDRSRKFYECKRMIELITSELADRREVNKNHTESDGIGQR